MADNNAAQPPEAKKEEKKQPTTLESVLKESSDAVKASTNALLGTGAIAAATGLFGLDGLVTAASFPIGRGILEYAKADGKSKFTSANFRDEAIAGALFTPPLWYGIEAVKQTPKAYGLEGTVANILGASVPVSPLLVGGLTFGVLTPALTALYYPLQYLMQNKTFKGMGKDFKKNYWKGLKRAMPLTAISSTMVAAAYAAPYLAPLLFPALALANIAYRIVLSPEKISYKKLGKTLLSPLYAPFYLAGGIASAAGKAYSKAATAAYSLGSAIGSLFKAAPKPTTAPAVAPAH
ncbi:hypothetical protein HYX05_00915 [Candidatus Woesearchaeota archaeon]|nr:hypothetical protein [Candidatus Woesearchaeota archaeon]